MTFVTDPIRSIHYDISKSGKQKVASKLKEKALKSSKHIKTPKKLNTPTKSLKKVIHSPTKLSLEDLPIPEICQVGTAPISPPRKKKSAVKSPSKINNKSLPKVSVKVEPTEQAIYVPMLSESSHNIKTEYSEISETIIPMPETPHLPKPKFSSTPYMGTGISDKRMRKKLKTLVENGKGKKSKKHDKKYPRTLTKPNLSMIADESVETSADNISRHSRSPNRPRSMSKSPKSVSPKRSTRSHSRSPTKSQDSCLRSPQSYYSRSPTRSRSRSHTRSRSWSPVKSRSCSKSDSPHRSRTISRSPSFNMSPIKSRSVSPHKSPNKSPTKSCSHSRSPSPTEHIRYIYIIIYFPFANYCLVN